MSDERVPRRVLAGASAATAAAFGFTFGGLARGVLALIAACCGLALADRMRAGSARPDVDAIGRFFRTVSASIPGALVVFLAFNGGGFFPAAPAFVAVLLLLLIAVQALVLPRPFAGLS